MLGDPAQEAIEKGKKIEKKGGKEGGCWGKVDKNKHIRREMHC